MPSAYFVNIINVFRLQKAGYPFQKNDLTYEQWLHLAEFKELLEQFTIEKSKLKSE